MTTNRGRGTARKSGMEISEGRRQARLLALAGALALFAAGAAMADPMEDASALISQGDAAGAYLILKPQERAEAGNPDYDYLLGISAIDSGRPAEAVAAFERVLAVKPDHLAARAELGRAYIAMNEPEAARRELATVEASDSVPDSVRETIDRYVTALDTGLSGGGTRIRNRLTVRAGYDSNINNSTSDSRILIPAFAGLGFATLGAGATSEEDVFGEVSGRTSLTHGLAIGKQLLLDLSASYRANSDFDQFNQGIAGINLGYSQQTPDHGTFAISAQAQSYWVDDEAYRYTYGALGQWTLRTKGLTDYAVYLQYSKLNYPSSSVQNANRYTAGATVGQSLGGPRNPYIYGGVYAGYEKLVDGNFDHLSYAFGGLRAGGEIDLMPKLDGYASAAIEVSEYDEPDPLFLEERSTIRGDVAAGLRYSLRDDLTLGGEVSYTRADSNIVLYDYDRVVASVSLSLDF
ncbi:porin family protein [Hoeflea sp.]|uniref:porin family protein n=1 Tax=Hoeflea sp. TaxID=1940281 RepID=UPI00199A47FF|nr:porin family protein [Hoeflea sp.]MBC7285794.1 tetratricopeptide repeat protein [Hoeflea sp.]